MGAVYDFTQKVGAFGVQLSAWARKILFVENVRLITCSNPGLQIINVGLVVMRNAHLGNVS
jgi:hypothetical protein